MNKIIQFRAYQEEVFWAKYRMMFWLWRRQSGKSWTLANWALRRMMDRENHLVTMVSASINLGGELLLKEAQVWRKVLSDYKKIAELKTSADDDNGELLDIDAIADIFEHNKLEARIYHSDAVYSRTRVIAPNPDTAVGWTGDILIDECGRIPNFKDVYEAILPFMDSNPDFNLIAATTPPPDENHYSYEMFLPPNKEWRHNPRGNWYQSPCGIMAHRLDAWDGDLAGAKYFHPQTREIITPELHRQLAFDKVAWDRNHGVKFIAGTTAAVRLADVQRAMSIGQNECVGIYKTEELKDVSELFSAGWEKFFKPGSPKIGVGFDVATTTNKKSNPSSIVFMQEVGGIYYARLALVFKNKNPQLPLDIILRVALNLPHGLKIGKVCIDASNERFFATSFAKRLKSMHIPCDMVDNAASTKYLGEKMNFKCFLGNLICNDFEDGSIAIPDEEWAKNNIRQVVRMKGTFSADVDAMGNHADFFDALKLARYAITGKRKPASVDIPVGSCLRPKSNISKKIIQPSTPKKGLYL